MKRICMILLATAVIGLITVTIQAEQKKCPPGMHPIIDVSTGYLFGGCVDSAWVDGEKLYPKVKGGEKYRIYSPTKFLGPATGKKAVLDEEGPWQSPTVELVCSAELDKELEKRKEPHFAIGGDWNALPRVPTWQSTKQDAYRQAVRDILDKHGLKKAEVNITALVRVDLEGDGTDEVLIAATTPREKYPEPDGLAGDYSLLVLRKLVKGKVVTIALDEEYYPQKQEFCAPNRYDMVAVLDVNGDGILEVIGSWWYYEGNGLAIYQVKDMKAKKVLIAGEGA